MIVIGIDPGVTTGVCEIDTSEPSFLVWELEYAEAVSWIYDRLARRGADVDYVAIERFTITTRTAKLSPYSEPMDVIGLVRGLCHVMKIPVKRQLPTDAKNSWTDDRLKEHGLYRIARGKGHSRDAMRHALLRIQNVNPELVGTLVVE